MLKVNDMVIYDYSGVYKIIDICSKNFSPVGEQMYYAMVPVFENNNVVYRPMDNKKVNMRRLIDESEAKKLLEIKNYFENIWIENDRERQLSFSDILKSNDLKRCINLYITLHLKRIEKKDEGKKMHISDEKVFIVVEKLILQEISIVLNIDLNSVKDLIFENLSNL